MNMYQSAFEASSDEDQESWLAKLAGMVLRLRYFILLVLAPTLLLTIYYYAFAADQYQSEARFVISDAADHGPSIGGVAALFGLSGSSGGAGQGIGVSDYLRSHDAVSALQAELPLVAMFRPPEADLISRLHHADPTPEQLLRYFRGKVGLANDRDSGITELTVRAFRSKDAFALNQALLALGERQVNAMNVRRYRDAVAMAERQVRSAEENSARIQRQITDYRQARSDIDPQTSGEVQIKLLADLRARIVEVSSQLDTMRGLIQPGSPQYVALQHKVASLRAQLAEQSARVGGSGNGIARSLGGYEELRVRQDFAAKRYDAAAAMLERARDAAQRQQLYLIRVVDANRPVQSLFPERGIVLTVFLALALAYGIGWLVLAGVREHAA